MLNRWYQRKWPILVFVVVLVLCNVVTLLKLFNISKGTSTANVAYDNSGRNLRVAFITAGLGIAYRNFAVTLFDSAEQYFCKDRRNIYAVDYILFTDNTYETTTPSKIVYKEKLGWPYDSQNRFTYILDSEKQLSLSSYDFLYWIDADQLFVDNVCEDILGTLVGAQHAWFPSPLKRPWPYENRTTSTAYIPQDNQFEQVYFHASFYGGASKEFLKMVKLMRAYMDIDHANGIQAAVDDESYLNKYYYDNPPTVVLSTGFVYPDWFTQIGVTLKTRKIILTRGKPKDPDQK